MTKGSTIIALDIGGQRIGVASAHMVARIASPLTTLQNTPQVMSDIKQLLAEHDAAALVVGLPRNLSGQTTEQTHAIKAFVDELKTHIKTPVYLQDEAVTSRQAEAELQKRRKPYRKEDIDALAATYILEDFLANQEVRI